MVQVIREFIKVYGMREFLVEIVVLPVCLIMMFVTVTILAAI